MNIPIFWDCFFHIIALYIILDRIPAIYSLTFFIILLIEYYIQ